MTTPALFLIDNRDFGISDSFLNGWLNPDKRVLWGLEAVTAFKFEDIDPYFLFAEGIQHASTAALKDWFQLTRSEASELFSFVDCEHYPIEVRACEITLDSLMNFELNFVGQTNWCSCFGGIGSPEAGTEVRIRCRLPIKGIIISASSDLHLVEQMYPEIPWEIHYPAEGDTWAIPKPQSQHHWRYWHC